MRPLSLIAALLVPSMAVLAQPPRMPHASLPDGVVLVDFLVYVPARGRDKQVAAWVVHKGKDTARINLGSLATIDADITAWRAALLKGEDAPAVAARLHKAVWQPLAKHVAGAKVVLLAPDDVLARLPFAALPGAKKGTYLIEDVAIATVPVPSLLLRLLAARPKAGPASLLAVGGVDYDARRPGPAVKPATKWAALPATAAEAKDAADRFRAAFPKAPITSLTGAKADKNATRNALTKVRFAHLATHGFFDPPWMKEAKRPDGRADGLFHRVGITGWHPGLLSGLVFAGANRPSRDDNGLLTAMEAAELDLSGLELAVLSGNDTALGKAAAGEGELGLARALAIAGCKSVVAALWGVDDRPTSVLVERFYHHLWVKKLSRAEALRQAQLDVLHHPTRLDKGRVKLPLRDGRCPPRVWAAYVLFGDWR